jgi:hypothetical protein
MKVKACDSFLGGVVGRGWVAEVVRTAPVSSVSAELDLVGVMMAGICAAGVFAGGLLASSRWVRLWLGAGD